MFAMFAIPPFHDLPPFVLPLFVIGDCDPQHTLLRRPGRNSEFAPPLLSVTLGNRDMLIDEESMRCLFSVPPHRHVVPISFSLDLRTPPFIAGCPLALLRGGQVPFSAASLLGKLAIIEPKKVPDPTPVIGYLRTMPTAESVGPSTWFTVAPES